MTDDKKTTTDSAESTQAENKSANEKPEPKPVADKESKESKEEAKNESSISQDEKTAIEEVATKTEKPKGKKGKSEFKTLKPKEIKPGMIVRVHQKIKETNPKGEEKERVQVFQGMVLAHKHGAEAGSTIMVRKVSGGIGVEKIFPLNMPSIDKIELVRTYQVRQARPYYLRTYKKRLSEVKA